MFFSCSLSLLFFCNSKNSRKPLAATEIFIDCANWSFCLNLIAGKFDSLLQAVKWQTILHVCNYVIIKIIHFICMFRLRIFMQIDRQIIFEKWTNFLNLDPILRIIPIIISNYLQHELHVYLVSDWILWQTEDKRGQIIEFFSTITIKYKIQKKNSF